MGNTTIQTQSFRAVDVGQRQRYIIPFALLCLLFFSLAVANNLNDILLPCFNRLYINQLPGWFRFSRHFILATLSFRSRRNTDEETQL